MTPKKLLIVHHGALGDVVATFPALIRLRRSFAHIDALLRGRLGEMAAGLKIIDRCYPLESAAFLSLYSEPVHPNTVQFLNTYDVIVLFSRLRALHQTVSKHIKGSAYLIPPRPDINQNINVVRHLLVALAGCGLINHVDENDDEILSARKCKYYREKEHHQASVLIHPGSGSTKKNWPLANFVKIALILESRGWRPEFIIGPADLFMASSLKTQEGLGAKIHIMDDLNELVVLLKTAGGFTGYDSGVSHLAAFLGLPSVAVFGPSDPYQWKPFGPCVAVVRPKLDCSPCFETKNLNCESMECLHGTSPEMVIDAFYRLIAGS